MQVKPKECYGPERSDGVRKRRMKRKGQTESKSLDSDKKIGKEILMLDDDQ